MNKLKAYCELVRAPNLFTAAADILAGYWLVTGEVQLSASLMLLLIASCCLYATGIIVNDLRDIETDRRERPHRPLPTGRIAAATAIRLAVALSVMGVVLAALAWSPTDPAGAFTFGNRTGLIAAALLGSILLYDLALKQTPLGPIAMGLCRALNLAMPISLAAFADPTTFRHVIALVIAFGVYVGALTWFGRDEAGVIRRRHLIGGFVGVLVALFGLGVISSALSDFDQLTMVIWLVLLVHLSRVCIRTIRRPAQQWVQYAMKTLIIGIIAFDAVIAASTAGWLAGVIVLAMMVPAAFLGRWVYST